MYTQSYFQIHFTFNFSSYVHYICPKLYKNNTNQNLVIGGTDEKECLIFKKKNQKTIYSRSLNNVISFNIVVIMLLRCCRNLTFVYINWPMVKLVLLSIKVAEPIHYIK